MIMHQGSHHVLHADHAHEQVVGDGCVTDMAEVASMSFE
jgi:hypothetical protein